MTQKPVPTDDELKRTVMEAARLQAQSLRWVMNVGSVALALALCVVVAIAGAWVVDAIGS